MSAADHTPSPTTDGLREAVEALGKDDTRCPGCGSVLVTDIGRSTCWKTTVDTTEPGYRYLADTWGYCYTLSRDIRISEGPVWLRDVLAAHPAPPSQTATECEEVQPACCEHHIPNGCWYDPCCIECPEDPS